MATSEDDLRRMGLTPGPGGIWSKGSTKEYVAKRKEEQESMRTGFRESIAQHFDKPVEITPLAARRLAFFNGKTRMLPFVQMLPRKFPFQKDKRFPLREWFDGTEPQHEYVVQLGLSAYTQKYYPDAEFKVDAMGNGMSKAQGGKLKQVNKRKGWPDFELYEHSGEYCGLFLELKTAKTKLFKKSGEWNGKVDPKTGITHLENQNICHEKMRERGWKGGFAKGIAQCIEAVDCYISGDFDRLDEFILTY